MEPVLSRLSCDPFSSEFAEISGRGLSGEEEGGRGVESGVLPLVRVTEFPVTWMTVVAADARADAVEGPVVVVDAPVGLV